MITVTHTAMSDEYDAWVRVEAWFLGARLASIEKYPPAIHRFSADMFDTPETLAEMTALAQPIFDNLKEYFSK